MIPISLPQTSSGDGSEAESPGWLRSNDPNDQNDRTPNCPIFTGAGSNSLLLAVSFMKLSRAVFSSMSVRLVRFVSSVVMVLACLWLLAGQLCMAQTAHAVGVITLGSGFNQPQGVAVDSSGNVYVADTQNNAVKQIPPGCTASSCVITLATTYTSGGGFNQPGGVALDSGGNVYVADTGNNAVKQIVAAGGYATVNTLASVYTQAGGFVSPNGVAVDPNGNIYVADNTNGVMKEIVAAGGYTTVNLLSSNIANHTGVAIPPYNIQVIYAVGSPNYSGVTGSVVELHIIYLGSDTVTVLFSGFANSMGLAVDGSGNIYVADTGNNAVKQIPPGCGASSCFNTLGSGFSSPYGVAVDANGNVYVADTGNNAVKEITTAVLLPATAVGSTSAAMTVAFTFDTGGQIGAPVVLTQGATGLDFADAMTGSCTNGTNNTTGTNYLYNARDTCTVDVTFKPKYPGQRMGAVQLTTTGGAVIATNLVYGTGTGPLATFPSNTTVNTLGGGFNNPFGVALDGSGNVYVADQAHNAVKKIPPGCTASSCVITLAASGGFSQPAGVALDGSGNVYVADQAHNAVKKIPPGCTASSCVITLAASGGFSQPAGVALDGAGNVYVADTGNNAVKQIVAAGGYTTVNTLGSGFINPFGVALDGGGNVYVADNGNNAVKQIVAAGGYQTVNMLGNGFSAPVGVALDGGGNVYVADYGNSLVRQILAAGGYQTVNTLGSGFSAPVGVALDGNGNIYVADNGNNAVKQIDLSDAPSLTFAATGVGSTSTDSPQTVTLANIGNDVLPFSIPASGNNPSICSGNNPCIPSNIFTLSSAGPAACPLVSYTSSNPGTLPAGTSCTLPISFTPGAAGSITGSQVLTDPNPNAAAPNYTTQTISLSGTANKGTPVFSSLSSPTISYSQGPTTLGGTILDGALAPSGSVTITLNGVGQQATIQSDGSFSYSFPTGALGAGGSPYAISYSYGGDANFNAPQNGGGTLTIGKAALTVTASSATVSYGDPAPAITPSFSGFVNGQGSAVLTTQPACTTTYTTASIPGSAQTTSCSGAAATNYSFTYVPGSLTVNKAGEAALQVTGVPASAQAYGTTFTAGSSGGSGTGVVTLSASGACSLSGTTVTMTAGSGTCTVTATKAADTDYSAATAAAAVDAVETQVAATVPVITGLSPMLMTVSSPAFTLTVSGENFQSTAAVQWNGSVRSTTVASSSQLTATITAADLASAGTVNVTVVNPASSGGTSAAFEFAVDGTTSSGGTTSASTVSVTAQSITLNVQAGQSFSFPVTLGGVAAGSQTAATCVNLPLNATCSYNSTTQTITIQTAANTPPGNYPVLVIFTVTQQTAALFRQRVVLASWTGLLGLPVGLLWFGGIRKKVLGFVVIGLLGLGLASSLTGCGGSPATPSPTMTTQASMAVTLNVH